MSNMYNTVVSWLSGLPGQFSAWFGSVLNYLWSLPGQMWNIGASILNSLWSGLQSVFSGLISWVSNIADSILGFFRGIIDGASSARGAARSVGGYSSATGIAWVPRNNYPIFAHQGERLLTQQQAREYADYEQGRSTGGGQGFAINIQNMTVRSDSDIDMIAQKLYNKVKKDKRGGGV